MYVDDILLLGQTDDVNEAESILKNQFSTTDLGICRYFLGIKIQYMSTGIFISQRPLIEKIIRLAEMETTKSADNPLPLSHYLYDQVKGMSESESDYMKSVPYWKVLGSLFYLSTRTQGDITTAVSMLGQFQEKTARVHWRLLKQVLRYLIGTISHGLLLPKSEGKCFLDAWSDTDWAPSMSKHRSRTDCIITIFGAAIVWCSKL